jgi:hypothetical protein
MLNMFILISLLLVYHVIINPYLRPIIPTLHLLCIPIIYYAHVHAYIGSPEEGVTLLELETMGEEVPPEV